MPLRSYTGPLLPGDKVGSTPPPPPPPRTVVRTGGIDVDEPREMRATQPAQALPVEFQGVSVTITDLGGSAVQVEGQGPSVEEAYHAAMLQYEAQQPVVPLVWQGGQPVEGLARDVLVQALENLSQLLGSGGAQEFHMMIGRLLGALGEAQ